MFFFPACFTPICTSEVCAFAEDYEKFAIRNVEILGLSGDDSATQKRFSHECNTPFPLLSDEGLKVAKLFGARGMLGVRRAYFLIDPEGKLIWQHAEVLPIFRLPNSRIFSTLDTLGIGNGSDAAGSEANEPQAPNDSFLPPHI